MLTRFVVQRRETFANGYEFPITGAYEKLVGKIYGEVDPKNRLNKVIVNLDKAPRNRRGQSRILERLLYFETGGHGPRQREDFLRRSQSRQQAHRLLSSTTRPASNDPSTLEDAGNGFLMRQGYTIVWCGWQGDLMPLKELAGAWASLSRPTTAKQITAQSPYRDRRRRKRNQIPAAQRRRARQELRSCVARQVSSVAHRTGKILRTDEFPFHPPNGNSLGA